MIDYTIIAFYFLLVLWIGLKSSRKIHSIKEFSIGDRNFSVTVLVATLSGTLIGGGTTLGLAEKTFSFGLIFLGAYSGILVERILTTIFIADKMGPFFGLITAGDIMEKLYGKTAKVLTGIGTVTTSIFILGANITTMGFMLEVFLGIPLHLSLAFSTISILVYSGYGGIAAVSFTDVVQFAFMLISIPLVALLSLSDVNGFKGIIESIPQAYVRIHEASHETLWQHGTIFLSYALPALYPVILQRMLMASSTKQIKLSLWFNTILSMFFFGMIALIGLIAFVKNPKLDPKHAFPSLIQDSLPIGVRGLVIVGLLATVMSTVDSFLNLIGVSFTHDVLQPLTASRLTTKQQLMTARIVAVLIGLAGLISALYLNSILENIFASMNIWLPFIFPPLFFGIRSNQGSFLSFISGIIAALLTLITFKLLGFSGFFPTLFAASANSMALFLVLRITKKRRKEFSLTDLARNSLKKMSTAVKKSRDEVKASLANSFAVSDIVAIFTLSFTILPIIASAGTDGKPATICLVVCFSIISVAVLIILRNLWPEKVFAKRIVYILPLFIGASQVTLPLINLLMTDPSPLLVINLLIGMTILWIFHPGISGLFWGALSAMFAIPSVAIVGVTSHTYGIIPQAIEAILRFLTLIYFVLDFRKKDRHQLERIDTLNSVLAHEVGHSILSMNFCAHRLRNALPVLLAAYRNGHINGNQNDAISPTDLTALEELSDRLTENAKRTKSTVQIIQTKIDSSDIEPPKSLMSVREPIEEAIKSGVRELINPGTTIRVNGTDFFVAATRGPLVHVFLNLIKNALEALKATENPRIDLALNADTKSISVIDNGPGIKASLIGKIFKESFTTKADGNGKGLHFCKLALREFGANISCKSEPGKTEFLIEF